MGFVAFFLDLFFLEETYPPVILITKAAELRRRTKNWGIHAKQEEIEIDFRELITKNFSRPMRLLFTEPIVLLLSIYMAFIYGLLYLFMTAYPIVFQRIHGMSGGIGGLPYFGMVIGMILAGVYIVLTQPSYNRKLAAGMESFPGFCWRLLLCSRPLLVRLVWLQILHPLDCPHTLGSPHWLRTAVYLPPISQLYRRRIPHVRGLSYRW